MSDLIVLNDENAKVYDRLVVSLEAGLGTLQVLLAVCDNSAMRQEIIRRYEQELGAQGVKVYRLALNPDEPSLLQALIDGQIDMNQQAIATVLGAEKLSNLGANNREKLDSFLGYLQWTREALRGYPLPMVLWLPSAVLVEVAQKAPDFWSWRSGGTFQFGFAKLNLPINDSGKDPIFKPIDNPQKSSSVLSIKQLESSLAEALTTWGEDSANIEPIYAQLGRAYAERVCIGETENLKLEIELAKTYLNKAITLQKKFKRDYDLTYSLNSLANMYKFLCYWDKAESLYKESLQILEKLEDRRGIAYIWGVLGDIERERGNWDTAESLYRQSLQLIIELDDRSMMATSWGQLGDIERYRGNWDAAESLYRQSLQLSTELDDRSLIATSWGVLGDIERNRGNWDAAESLYRQSLQLKTELGDRDGMASSWGVLGDIERNRGNWDAAESLYRQSLQLKTELGDRVDIAMVSFDFALLEKQRGNLSLAQQYYDKAKTIYQQLGAIKDLERIEKEWQN
ncbi:tetratricopeptide repeat protein [Pseudanabaena sp. ABRG5-3]|uniref:tetratricopeptide repeat protein n=1 Tax=Pseudanabaena sp. ABRG5-3 TaxID=685565 RepID=UPI000DC7039D|nr:tetratricopeptide repeat protein [Pseudanabaena sp. ABRG5-3]BBC25849.1 tetratricopeptide TPR_2 repeat protein [Pseudanabaena sp. ABRG5-3]